MLNFNPIGRRISGFAQFEDLGSGFDSGNGGFDPGFSDPSAGFDPGAGLDLGGSGWDFGSIVDPAGSGFDTGGGLSLGGVDTTAPAGDMFPGLPDYLDLSGGTFEPTPGVSSPFPGLGENAPAGTATTPGGSGFDWGGLLSDAQTAYSTGQGLLGQFGFGIDLTKLLGGDSPIVSKTPGSGTPATGGTPKPGTAGTGAGGGTPASGGMSLVLLGVAALFLLGKK